MKKIIAVICFILLVFGAAFADTKTLSKSSPIITSDGLSHTFVLIYDKDNFENTETFLWNDVISGFSSKSGISSIYFTFIFDRSNGYKPQILGVTTSTSSPCIPSKMDNDRVLVKANGTIYTFPVEQSSYDSNGSAPYYFSSISVCSLNNLSVFINDLVKEKSKELTVRLYLDTIKMDIQMPTVYFIQALSFDSKTINSLIK
jgi:hypothetical protein